MNLNFKNQTNENTSALQKILPTALWAGPNYPQQLAVGRKALMYVYCKFFRPQRKREDFQSSSPPPYFLQVLRFASRRVPNILEMQKKPQKRVAKRAHPFCASARSHV